jgi:arabinogalactan endo-1,4-beta-galactosidase
VALSEKISVSASGQTTWVHDVENVLAGLPNGHGLGVLYWEPGWVGNAGLGSSCSVSLNAISQTMVLTPKIGCSSRGQQWKHSVIYQLVLAYEYSLLLNGDA